MIENVFFGQPQEDDFGRPYLRSINFLVLKVGFEMNE
jgi:hypothetical protein